MIHKHHRVQGRFLGIDRDLPFVSEIAEPRINLRPCHGFRVAFAVESDEITDPGAVVFSVRQATSRARMSAWKRSIMRVGLGRGTSSYATFL